jgi:hypothetical protein
MTLPAVPVVTPERLISFGGLTADPEDEELVDLCSAVDEFVRNLPSVATFVSPLDEAAWPYRYALGARMLAARLWKRRKSPEGVASFTGEGVIYVRRNDPDICDLLRLNFGALG